MPMIAVQGIRGGVGATSLAVGLGWALAALGEKVMLVDACRDNLLALHLNQHFAERTGAMAAYLKHEPWYDSAFQFQDRLDFLPFGDVSEDMVMAQATTPDFFRRAQFEPLLSRGGYDWVIFDLPASALLDAWPLLGELDFRALVVTADANCHIRLSSMTPPEKTQYCLNLFSANDPIQQDLSLLWQNRFAASFLPLICHADSAMAEALMMKQPVGMWKPDSLIADELNTWANWCLLHLKAGVHA